MAFFKVIINYLIGYINIEIEGYYIERFINECIHKGVFIWKTDRSKSVLMSAKIGANDLDIANKLAEKYQCRITIKEKKGLPFFIIKHKNRKWLLIM